MSDDDRRKVTPSMVREQNLNPLLENDQDVQALMVTPQTGKAQIGNDLKNNFVIETQEGDISKRRRFNVWNLLSGVTSDERLSNYRNEHQERYARFCMKMEGWCIDEGMAKPAATLRWMRVAMNETGLGRNMALRNNLQEIRQKTESLMVEQKPNEKKFLGGVLG